MMPLARFLEFGGEQLAFYLGKDLGDLVRVTLSKYAHPDHLDCRISQMLISSAVEATLAIILLMNCE
jgi:Ca2+:H+ antiporter